MPSTTLGGLLDSARRIVPPVLLPASGSRLPTSLRSNDAAKHRATLGRPSLFDAPHHAARPRTRSAASISLTLPSRSTVLFVLGCLAWYTSSALSSNLAKALLSLSPRQKALPDSQRPMAPPFPYPVTLTMIQFIFVHLFAGLCGSRRLLGGFAMTTIVKPSWARVMEVGRLSVFGVVGHIFSSLAISRVPVATVHTIKALSPLFTVLSYTYLFGVSYSSRTYFSLAPLTFGVMLACSGFSFSADDIVGFTAALGSTFVFVAQNIYSKKLLRKGEKAKQERELGLRSDDAKMDKLNVLFYASGCSAVLMLPVVLYYDSHALFAASTPDPAAASTFKTLSLIFGNGIVYSLQSILAFSILSLVSPVTYSIASLLKRIFVIILALVWFHQQVRFLQLVGIVLTFAGLWLYTDAKTRDEVDKAEGKMRRREGEELEGVLPTRQVRSTAFSTTAPTAAATAMPMTQQQRQRQHQQDLYDRIAQAGPYQPPRMVRSYVHDPRNSFPSPPYSDKE
ncbi:uncharacterized protein PFL1_01447 [Pseudozyma flocculosa PF-1]|uniref:Related to SLY41 - Putative transporter of the triose phosphate translocator family n=1 Tax=Pseudozyma flocculosa TaxID=84751 RepID=A0A5C3EYN5_9BASI|nr:uncharacterized protein PFL1_01447 [Pseudozyma flocculosa PF-1]EPQ31262.1 hypothetical protein PFL1_01447 [Pseudozyma flocculosa PF-1]SPO36239.1 related to SLY41 - Putative transporter of the triose phosphate translocator family [Pseudozyma flocculosa]